MIADNKSFSLTAEKLYLTQPTVSAYISKLESELGEKLFYRTTKEVALTEAGKKIYIYAKDIIELAEKIENAFKESPEEGPRRMVISASSIPGTYLLPGILAEFSSAFPNVELRVQETDSVGVMNDIREHRADLGFVGTAVKDREISFLPFCVNRVPDSCLSFNSRRYFPSSVRELPSAKSRGCAVAFLSEKYPLAWISTSLPGIGFSAHTSFMSRPFISRHAAGAHMSSFTLLIIVSSVPPPDDCVGRRLRTELRSFTATAKCVLQLRAQIALSVLYIQNRVFLCRKSYFALFVVYCLGMPLLRSFVFVWNGGACEKRFFQKLHGVPP